MQRAGVALLLVGTASAFPTPDKYKPLIEACEGIDQLANCTAQQQGVCQTSENGMRTCNMHHCDHKKSPFFKAMHKLSSKLFKHDEHSEDEHPHNGIMNQVGDCEAKKDGETCTAAVEGKCIPTGKCPVFKGQTVCRPNNAHPPKFVTDACKDKKEGDECKMMMMSGKCKKIKYFDDLTCKVAWPHFLEAKEQNEDKPELVTV